MRDCNVNVDNVSHNVFVIYGPDSMESSSDADSPLDRNCLLRHFEHNPWLSSVDEAK